jgi:hypothetical protein
MPEAGQNPCQRIADDSLTCMDQRECGVRVGGDILQEHVLSHRSGKRRECRCSDLVECGKRGVRCRCEKEQPVSDRVCVQDAVLSGGKKGGSQALRCGSVVQSYKVGASLGEWTEDHLVHRCAQRPKLNQ